jgi:hypothetical protein
MPNARRCGNCRQTGHNARTCPNRTGAVRYNGTPMGSVRPPAQSRSIEQQYAEGDWQVRATMLAQVSRVPVDMPEHLAVWAAGQSSMVANLERQVRLLQLIRDATPPRPPVVAKSPMPKHISNKVFEGQDCMICLSATTIDTFTLSKCGHSYCNTCYNDARVRQCGECRSDAM